MSHTVTRVIAKSDWRDFTAAFTDAVCWQDCEFMIWKLKHWFNSLDFFVRNSSGSCILAIQPPCPTSLSSFSRVPYTPATSSFRNGFLVEMLCWVKREKLTWIHKDFVECLTVSLKVLLTLYLILWILRFQTTSVFFNFSVLLSITYDMACLFQSCSADPYPWQWSPCPCVSIIC